VLQVKVKVRIQVQLCTCYSTAYTITKSHHQKLLLTVCSSQLTTHTLSRMENEQY